MRVFIADDSAVIVERLADLLKEIPVWSSQDMQ